MINRFSVPLLETSTIDLANVASNKIEPETVLTNARILSTYSDRILKDKELWIFKGRIACIKTSGSYKEFFQMDKSKIYEVNNNILAPGLIDPHMHIESSMMTGCAYAEAALLNGTTTIFCDSHEIGNVCDTDGIEWMLQDCRESPISIFLTLPSTIPATNKYLETAGGDLTDKKTAILFDKWTEINGLGE